MIFCFIHQTGRPDCTPITRRTRGCSPMMKSLHTRLSHNKAQSISLSTTMATATIFPRYAKTAEEVNVTRKAHSRCARTKNGDTQIVCLRHRVSHYRVIEDARSGASRISTHGRRATLKRVTYLISSWGPMPLIRDAC
jgi:hypothetical protein